MAVLLDELALDSAIAWADLVDFGSHVGSEEYWLTVLAERERMNYTLIFRAQRRDLQYASGVVPLARAYPAYR